MWLLMCLLMRVYWCDVFRWWSAKRKRTLHLHCIARREKKHYPQVYVEESKYRMKKTKTTKFIEAKLEWESESESEIKLELKSELESDTE